ncbi:MAG: NAD(P)/FAD-dependent oxidoreductase [Anaerolineae bacterium]
MNIAIVGAGFCGLASAWHLLEAGQCKVSLFDVKGIGGGASGIATGLMHPYPGEAGRYSFKADEALGAACRLLTISEEILTQPVAKRNGILRLAVNEKQRHSFLEHMAKRSDVELVSYHESPIENPLFLIRSGLTVNAPLYLEGLWRACEAKGARFFQKKIDSVAELESFDQVIFTVGAGIRQLEDFSHLKLRFLKGQVLSCIWPHLKPPLKQSMIARGYIAEGFMPHTYLLGATYERDFISEEPCLEKAQNELMSKMAFFFPFISDFKILDCKAGVRVASAYGHLPMIGRINPSVWVITAMGSRGLLYHALMAHYLSSAIFLNDESLIPEAFRFK